MGKQASSLADEIVATAQARTRGWVKCVTCRLLSPERQVAIREAREKNVSYPAIAHHVRTVWKIDLTVHSVKAHLTGRHGE